MSALSLHDLRIEGPSGPIVSHMDLVIEAGRTLAVVGESGSGKSMTAKAMTGLLPRGVSATGTMLLGSDTIDLSLGTTVLVPHRGRRISLLLQNPFTSLSPVHRCGQQIAAALPAGRRTDEEVQRRLREVDLPDRVARQYPFELSGGMRQRVALAASLAADPQVLIADEPTTALDVTTQREVLDLVARLQAERSMAVLLITHDLGVARERADQVIVMYAGRAVETGSVDAVLSTPQHPYSAGLRDAEPPLADRLAVLPAIPGSVPRAWTITSGCAFAPRCDRADSRCHTDTPPLAGVAHHVACWHPLDATDVARTPLVAPLESTSTAPLLVTVRDAHRRFSADAPPALDGVTITVAEGEAVGIVGESGSGKTTLARCLVGLDRLDRGDIEWSTESGSGPRRAQIVFQDPTSALNPSLSIGTALAEALRAGGRSKDDVPEMLRLVGLPAEYATRRPAGLSGGEQQRVAIARAIAPNPRLLVCDEPVSSLDVSVQAQILNLMNDLRRRLGLALLFITHDLAVVRQVATRVYVMHDGHVVETGSMDELVRAPAADYTRQLFAAVPRS